MMAGCPLQELHLTGNPLGEGGMHPLAAALRENIPLERLFLRSTQLHTEGLQPLVAALRVNRTLKTVDLSENSIASGGAASLAEVLCQGASLESVYLGRNSVGFRGALTLLQALENCYSLKNLDVSDNFDWDSDGEEEAESHGQAFAAAVEQSCSLTELDASYNKLSRESVSRIEKALDRNRRPLLPLTVQITKATDDPGDDSWSFTACTMAGTEVASVQSKRCERESVAAVRRRLVQAVLAVPEYIDRRVRLLLCDGTDFTGGSDVACLVDSLQR
eukprot:TRINITY_DN107130_c0_g1_i1.p1 TRINITY_DN107130_c0_g1~~TRINITY_DN107130_c0_g1_i1.p1  ORF type:complete len:299 (-),score=66.58 TRINITY_DN107130_c0_g1_i1:48-875(-)